MTRPAVIKFGYGNQDESNFKNDESSKLKNLVCNFCGKTFLRKANLTFHISSHNSEKNIPRNVKDTHSSESQNTCNICCKKFTAKKNLLKHLRDVHKNFKEANRMVVKKLKCPERNCEFICRMMKELRSHIECCHQIKILKDTLQFPNDKAFQKWKIEEESNTISWFVTNRKKTTLIDGTKKQTLGCHRTGNYNPKGLGKYRMRSVGSCKIGVTCPATMEVSEFSDGHLTVVYYKTHLGHMQDVVYLKLSREERAYLAEKIQQGFSFDAILEDIKDSNCSSDSKKKRIQFLSKKYLYGIRRSTKNNDEKKGNYEKNNNKKLSQVKENEVVLKIPEKADENIHNSLTLYSPHGVIIPEEVTNENTATLRYQKDPSSSEENDSSQIVILSPEMDYSSVAEIILLPASETTSHSEFLSQNKLPIIEDITNEVPKINLDEKNRMNRYNLRMQLEKKIDRVIEFLPETEFLTPNQFELIKFKLDGVLSIFDAAIAKAKARKPNLKTRIAQHNKSFNNLEKEKEIKKFPEKYSKEKMRQQFYENSVVYTVYK